MMLVHDPTYLPDDYAAPNDVAVLGRGKRWIKHEGNRRLKELVQKELPAYLAAFNRKDKSAIILRVLQNMRKQSEGNIGLVRYDTLTGKWTLVDDGTARVSIAQLFRDALCVYYKSSRQHKQKLRRENKIQRSISNSSESSKESTSSSQEEEKEENRSASPSVSKSAITKHIMNRSASPSVSKSAIKKHIMKKTAAAAVTSTSTTAATTAPATPVTNERLSSLLQQTQEIVAESGDEGSVASSGAAVPSRVSSDYAAAAAEPVGKESQVLESLFTAFGGSADVEMDANPFEPTPMAEAMDFAPTPIGSFKPPGQRSSFPTSLRDLFFLRETLQQQQPKDSPQPSYAFSA